MTLLGRRRRRAASLVVVTLAAATWTSTLASAEGATKGELGVVRAATATYHDAGVAVADAFTATDDCVASPAGVMGYHYLNFGRLGAPLDVRKPAILLYEPALNGGRRLVGVEYFKADTDQDLATDGDRPSLFGVPFDGPMPGHLEAMPIHYDLHLWIWQHNPAGMFAELNPAGTC